MIRITYVNNLTLRRASLEEVPFAKEFEFRAENYSMELAEKEICRTLK
jgi:hypothetical protein